MSHARVTRRRLLGAMGAAGALAALPSCKRRNDLRDGQGVIVHRSETMAFRRAPAIARRLLGIEG